MVDPGAPDPSPSRLLSEPVFTSPPPSLVGSLSGVLSISWSERSTPNVSVNENISEVLRYAPGSEDMISSRSSGMTTVSIASSRSITYISVSVADCIQSALAAGSKIKPAGKKSLILISARSWNPWLATVILYVSISP